MPKKFQTYQCGVCKRSIDKEFDPRRSFINKCTITFGCTGTLNKINEKDVGSLHATYQFGVENWRSRFAETYTNVDERIETLVPITTTLDKSITFGVDLELLKIDPNDPNTDYRDSITLTVFKITDTSQNYKEFQFKVGDGISSGYIISGTDSSNNKFKFTDTDDIFVFNNGVQLQEDDVGGYTTYLTDSSLSENSIKINNAVTAYALITITVRKKLDGRDVELTFSSNALRSTPSNGAWSNINDVTSLVELSDGTFAPKVYRLFTLDNPDSLGEDVRIQAKFGKADNAIALFKSTSPAIKRYHTLSANTSALVILLSERQCKNTDRQLNILINFAGLRGVNGYLKRIKYENAYEWMVPTFPIIQIPKQIEVKSYIKINNIDQTDAIVLNDKMKTVGELLNSSSPRIINK